MHVPVEAARGSSLRFVGQYRSDDQDAVRDPATESPILLRSSSGAFTRSSARAINDLRIDVLFSFRPKPGTVVFAGYGSSFTEADAFRFDDLRRVRDGFFVKLGYLFRV